MADDVERRHRFSLVMEDSVGDLFRCSCGAQDWDYAQGVDAYARHLAAIRANLAAARPAAALAQSSDGSLDAADVERDADGKPIRFWWCPAWGTLNATRYHGNDGPDDPNCGKVSYFRAARLSEHSDTPDDLGARLETLLPQALADADMADSDVHDWTGSEYVIRLAAALASALRSSTP